MHRLREIVIQMILLIEKIYIKPYKTVSEISICLPLEINEVIMYVIFFLSHPGLVLCHGNPNKLIHGESIPIHALFFLILFNSCVDVFCIHVLYIYESNWKLKNASRTHGQQCGDCWGEGGIKGLKW